jgi:hypothetical protein
VNALGLGDLGCELAIFADDLRLEDERRPAHVKGLGSRDDLALAHGTHEVGLGFDGGNPSRSLGQVQKRANGGVQYCFAGGFGHSRVPSVGVRHVMSPAAHDNEGISA